MLGMAPVIIVRGLNKNLGKRASEVILGCTQWEEESFVG